jgi:hypothetical protein
VADRIARRLVEETKKARALQALPAVPAVPAAAGTPPAAN